MNVLPRIQYRLLARDRLREVARLVCNVFLRQEPLCRTVVSWYSPREAINLYSKFFDYCYYVSENATESGCSVMALDMDIDRVVGICMAEDFYASIKREQTNGVAVTRPEEFYPLFALLGGLQLRYMNQMDGLFDRPNTALHTHFLATSMTHRGLGLGSALVNEVLQKASASRFQFVMAECSSSASANIFLDKCGFKTVMAQDYASFVYGGHYPFVTISEPADCLLVRKDLNSAS
mmetsp:Transcript_24732/g.41498  ORF Transcript_24732/g.41498 Transcript_24732/m.41498 type:complete len:235 (+) Transcript_24732:42-746(+)